MLVRSHLEPLPVTAALREELPVAQMSWLGGEASWLGGAAKTVGGAAADATAWAVAGAAGWAGARLRDALSVRGEEEVPHFHEVRGDDGVGEFREDRAALQEWRAQGVRGPQNLQAPTRAGGFGAAYDPNVEQLLIRLAGGVTFADSITFLGELAMASHPQPGGALTSFVRQVNLLPAADRRTAAAPCMWTTAEQTAFLNKFNTGIANRWGGKHEFHATKRNWTDLSAKVDVVAAVHAGAQSEDEHVSLTVYKTPPGGAGPIGLEATASRGSPQS